MGSVVMSPDEQVIRATLDAASAWYESYRLKNGRVFFNVLVVGVAVSNFLRTEPFPLQSDSITSKEGGELKKIRGTFKSVVSQRGIKGKTTVEFGRTSRNTLVKAQKLVDAINGVLEPHEPDYIMLATVSDALEDFFIERMQVDYFNKQKLSVLIDAKKPVSVIVGDIMDAANQREGSATGTIAQHLVGAKLELRFPEQEIGRDRVNAADQHTHRQGDFQIGDTAIHVTMAPMDKLVDRVRGNMRDGYRSVVLVPEARIQYARGLFEVNEDLAGRVGVQSIETYIGTNIEEIADYDSRAVERAVALLIRTYNERIEDVETDMSLRIEEPEWFNKVF